MATRKSNGVIMKVDERSIKSFKSKVGSLITAIGDEAEEQLTNFCVDVLTLSNDLVPIDTATLAESADFKVERSQQGYFAKMGYGVIKDPVNPRTGLRASAYAAEVHENYHFTPAPGAIQNGQAKFFETALWQLTGDFFMSTGKALRSVLAAPESKISKAKKFKSFTDAKQYIDYAQRASSGFTARHGGKILPYPLNSAVRTGNRYTSKTAQGSRQTVRHRLANQRGKIAEKVANERYQRNKQQ